jgi:LEA14-like dessication related protein
MSILERQMMKLVMKTQIRRILLYVLTVACVTMILGACTKPDQDIVLRQIRDVVVDANSDPTLKANAVFFNPNKQRGKLKKIDVEIYVNGKKAGHVDETYNTAIPSKAEFTIPLKVKLAMKELGTMQTLMGVLGGKKFEVVYKGSLRITYHGVPIKVPIDHKDDVRISF